MGPVRTPEATGKQRALGSVGTTPAASPWRSRLDRLPRGSWLLDLGLILVGLAVLFALPVAPPHPQWQPGVPFWHDGWIRYRVIEAFVHGTPVRQLRFVDPLWSDRWPYFPLLFATPFWYLGELVETPSWWIARFNWFVFTGCLVLLWFSLRQRVDRRLLRIVFLLVLAGSMFPGHLAAFFPQEIFAVMLIGTGLVVAHARWPLAGWTLVVLGAASVPANLVPLVVVVLVVIVLRRRLRLLVVPLAVVTLVVADQWVRNGKLGLGSGYASYDHGTPTVLPYSGRSGFNYPLGFGILGLLFSFGRGLIFFAPGLFLPARRALCRVYSGLGRAHLLLVVFVVGLLLIYARWWSWDGGFFWGPRFLLLAAVPAALALGVWLYRPPASLLARLGLLVVLAMSVWVAIDGAVFGLSGLGICDPPAGSNQDYLCDDAPEFSVLWHPFVGGLHIAGRRHWAYVLFALAVFVRLAAPLVVGMGRDARRRWPTRLRGKQLLAGWRI